MIMKWIKYIVSWIFSKMVLGIILIIIQAGWLLYLLYWATSVSRGLDVAIHVLALVLALVIVDKDDTRPYFKLSWVFFILVLPVAGSFCYLMFGRSGLTKKRSGWLREINQKIDPNRREDPALKEALKEENQDAWRQSEYITTHAGYPLCPEVDSTYYPSGEEVFPQFLEDLKAAKEYIFMEYFIIQAGLMWDEVLAILVQKVHEGVKVRMMYDDVGSINTLPYHFYKQLEEKGIECAVFHPFHPVLSVIINNRDHRKICVVDGQVAYTGGFNLADEYINEITRFGYWKDEGIRVTGPAAWSFTLMFLELWNYSTGSREDGMEYCPPECRRMVENAQEPLPAPGRGYVQPFSDSPLDKEKVSESVYLSIINRAHDYVYIFTPYLIPSQEITTALINAAKSGVDVRIVTPGIPDKQIAYLLTQSNYVPLMRGGVKIYQFTPGFIHSKCILADDTTGVVGTINFDYRSLYLHFECGVYLYQAAAIAKLKEDMLNTFAVSREVSLTERKSRNVLLQLFLSVMRLLAPLF